MSITLLHGDCLALLPTLPANSVHCVVTSPPYYGLRDYQVDGQLGLEQSPEEYVERIVAVFREVKRVLRPDGTLWLNLGDSYSSGSRTTQCDPSGNTGAATLADGGARRAPAGIAKPKDLLMMPARIAIALQADGWYLRSDIVWAKPNPMPESVRDRPTSSYEHVFLLAKQKHYYYDQEAIREPASTNSHGGGRDHPYRHNRQTKGNGHEGLLTARPAGDLGRNCRNVWRPTAYHAKIDASDLSRDEKAAAHVALEGALDDVEAGVLADFRMRIRGVGAPLNGTDEAIGGRQRRLAEQGFYIMPIYGRGITTNVWDISTKPFRQAHFATMPLELAERCILAGTSEHGCCATCGAPWRREFAPRKQRRSWNPDHTVAPEKGHRKPCGQATWNDYEPPHQVGWRPSCLCDAAVIPCTVLDPFGGAGTTSFAATKHGRDAISIELNPAYTELARERLLIVA